MPLREHIEQRGASLLVNKCLRHYWCYQQQYFSTPRCWFGEPNLSVVRHAATRTYRTAWTYRLRRQSLRRVRVFALLCEKTLRTLR
jgi:hypothetical protein